MQIQKPGTFLVLATDSSNSGPELELQKQFLSESLGTEDIQNQVIFIEAKDEEDLANRIARNKDLHPIQNLILFAESQHAISLRPIFRRKFGKALEIEKFKADFEFDHPWVSTSSTLTWFSRNFFLRVWFGMKQRMGRRTRKRLKSLFWS